MSAEATPELSPVERIRAEIAARRADLEQTRGAIAVTKQMVKDGVERVDTLCVQFGAQRERIALLEQQATEAENETVLRAKLDTRNKPKPSEVAARAQGNGEAHMAAEQHA